MKLGRRSFLKILGGAAAATVAAPLIKPVSAAPLFVPAQHLDMGVPRRILTATELPPSTSMLTWQNTMIGPEEVQMLLLHDEFSPPYWQQYGREKVPAGTTLLVDRETADRWVKHGVAAPGPSAPRDLQETAAARLAEKRARDHDPWRDGQTWRPILATVEQMPSAVVAYRDDVLAAMIERAQAKAARRAANPDMAWWDES